MDRVQAANARHALLSLWDPPAKADAKSRLKQAIERRWLGFDYPFPTDRAPPRIRPQEWTRLTGTFLPFCAARFTNDFVWSAAASPRRIDVPLTCALYTAYVCETRDVPALPRAAQVALTASASYIAQIMLRLLPERLLESSLHALCTAHGLAPQGNDWFNEVLLTAVRWQRAVNALYVARPAVDKLADMFPASEVALRRIADVVDTSPIFVAIVHSRLRNHHSAELTPLVKELMPDQPARPARVKLAELVALRPTVSEAQGWDDTVAFAAEGLIAKRLAAWRPHMTVDGVSHRLTKQ
jgi:hypothetical protein